MKIFRLICLVFVGSWSLQSCSAGGVVYIPSPEPGLVGYVYGWTDSDPEKLEREVNVAVERHRRGEILVQDRSETEWQSNSVTTHYYSGVTRTATLTETYAPSSSTTHGMIVALYEDEPPSNEEPTAWELRVQEVKTACEGVGFTEECTRVSGRALHSSAHDFTSLALPHPRSFLDYDDLDGLESYCDQGHGTACKMMGFHYKNAAHGLNRSIQTSQMYLKKACDLGEPLACSSYAHKLERLPGETDDDLRGRKAALRARGDMLEGRYCKWGQVSDCPRQQENIAQRCEAGQLEWCHWQKGQEYRKAVETGKDRSHLVEWFQELCAQGSAAGCVSAANAAADEEEQWALRAKACWLGSAGACKAIRRR